MKTKVILYAEEGKILTDGGIYGRTIYLAEGRSADEFHEITEEEYNNIVEAEIDKNNIIKENSNEALIDEIEE